MTISEIIATLVAVLTILGTWWKMLSSSKVTTAAIEELKRLGGTGTTGQVNVEKDIIRLDTRQDQVDRENEAAQVADPAAPLSPLDSRRHIRDVELYSGKVGVLVEEAKELLHGKPFAKTIAVASVLTATGLFLVATRLPD